MIIALYKHKKIKTNLIKQLNHIGETLEIEKIIIELNF